MEIPEKCKICKHYNHCKRKNNARGSKNCRTMLGEEQANEEILEQKWISISLLWYYYNQSKK